MVGSQPGRSWGADARGTFGVRWVPDVLVRCGPGMPGPYGYLALVMALRAGARPLQILPRRFGVRLGERIKCA